MKWHVSPESPNRIASAPLNPNLCYNCFTFSHQPMFETSPLFFTPMCSFWGAFTSPFVTLFFAFWNGFILTSDTVVWQKQPHITVADAFYAHAGHYGHSDDTDREQELNIPLVECSFLKGLWRSVVQTNKLIQAPGSLMSLLFCFNSGVQHLYVCGKGQVRKVFWLLLLTVAVRCTHGPVWDLPSSNSVFV